MNCKYFLITLLFLCPLFAKAQWKDHLYDDDHTEAYQEIGLFGGIAYYHGDLQTDWFPSINNGAGKGGGIVYKRFFNPNIGFRSSFSYYNNIWASDSLSTIAANKARNLDFHTNLLELSAGFELNFTKFGRKYHKVSPYIFGGLSVFYHNPYSDSFGTKIYLKPLSTEGQGMAQYPDRKPYALISTGWTFGGGFKFLIAQKMTLGLEVGFRYLSSDYFDDVSRTYVNLDTLKRYKGLQSVEYSFKGDKIANWDGSYPTNNFQRGNPNNNDWYYTGTLNLAIYFDAIERNRIYRVFKCIQTKQNNPVSF